MIRIGVIGAGPNGTGNAKKLAADGKRARIVAVADIDPAAGRKLAAAHDARCVADCRDLLDDVDKPIQRRPSSLWSLSFGREAQDLERRPLRFLRDPGEAFVCP